MDPLVLAELWWTAPVALGAIGAGAWAVRRRGADRRLGYDAARLELKQAIDQALADQNAVKIAKAEAAEAAARFSASRPDAVAGARRALQEAQRRAKGSAAAVKAHRARVAKERAEIPKRDEPTPLERLRAEHDAVLGRWMAYETDPAVAIAYPTMGDVAVPQTRAFLEQVETAQRLRPGGDTVTVAEFVEYRRAVARLTALFDEAESAARIAAGEAPPAPGWQEAAQQMITLSADMLDRAAGAAASALAAWRARRDG